MYIEYIRTKLIYLLYYKIKEQIPSKSTTFIYNVFGFRELNE